MSFVASVFTLLMSILILTLPRKYMLIPLIMGACYVTIAQRLIIAGLDFNIIRILVSIGWISLIIRGELSFSSLNKIDKILICWIISDIILNTILWGTFNAFINRLGNAYNGIGLYFLFRSTLTSSEQIIKNLRYISIIIVPMAFLMLIEKKTGYNSFSVFDGVPAYSLVREGSVRCQGPFRHAILAGTFGATMFPVMVGLYFADKKKVYAIIGMITSTLVMLAASSSGPLMSYCFTILGIFVWFVRCHMRKIRWGIVFLIIALDIVMKAPVWYAIARMGNLVGGHAWHRAHLINQAITHFNEWWLCGTTYTAHWMPTAIYVDSNMADITNQFIGQGVQGGVLTMILFIFIIVFCFQAIGKSVRNMEGLHSKSEQFFVWTFGVSLLGHVVSFMSVTYFDQIIVFWYLLLAVISVLYRVYETSDKNGESFVINSKVMNNLGIQI